jgi:hypothetical protein
MDIATQLNRLFQKIKILMPTAQKKFTTSDLVSTVSSGTSGYAWVKDVNVE